MADSCCKILHTRTTKNQKLLFPYLNTVVKMLWFWYNKTYNLSSACKNPHHHSMRSKTNRLDEQQSLTSRFPCEPRTTLSLHAWGQGRTDRNSLEAEWGRKMAFTRDMNRMSLADTLNFNYIPYIRSGRLTNWAKSSQDQTAVYNCRACVCKSNVEIRIRIRGDKRSPQKLSNSNLNNLKIFKIINIH